MKKTKQLGITEDSCRLCLRKCTNSDQESQKYAERYNICTGFEISDGDIPKKICTKCKTQLNKFWYFRNKCNRTESTLLENFIKPSVEFMAQKPKVEKEEPEEFFDPQNLLENGGIKHEPVFADPLYEMLSTQEQQQEHKNPVIVCDICGATYRDKYFFRDHRMEHFVQPDDPKFMCDICMNRYPQRSLIKSSFTTKKKLLVHMQRNHLRKRRKFPCQQCGKELNDKATLRFHTYQQHVDPKEYKYECHICSQRFFKRSALQDHNFRHSGEKRHTCNICGQKFTTSGHRSQHMTSLHNLSIQNCEVCGKVFNNLRYLKQHMQSHNQDYKCPICPDKAFSLTTTLRSHIKTNHAFEIALPPPGTKLKNYDWSKVIVGRTM